MLADPGPKGPKMTLLYNAIQIICLPLAAPILAMVCLAKEKYRGQFLQRLGEIPPLPVSKGIESKRAWIHSMSLGEFNAARPLIQGIKKKWPGLQLILSASTASGLAAIEKSPLSKGAIVTALPFDFLPIVDRVIKSLRPDCFLLVETDIWPNFLWRLKRHEIPAILINGSISEKSARRLERLPTVANFLYGPFSHLVMQSEDDVTRLSRLDIMTHKIMSHGNLKFDYQPREISPEEKEALFHATGFPEGTKIIVAGSTHPGEEEEIAEAFSNIKKAIPTSRLIIAPRDIKRAQEVERIFTTRGNICTMRSNSPGPRSARDIPDVFILDTLGELGKFYSLASVSFVGGSLVPVGGHNILEPAVFGVPVVFGPFMESFMQIASAFLDHNAGFQVADAKGLEKIVSKLLADDKILKGVGDSARRLLDMNRGVVDRYLDLLSPYLSQ